MEKLSKKKIRKKSDMDWKMWREKNGRTGSKEEKESWEEVG